MIQLSAHHVWYLIMAAQWTVLLSLIAFAGGALVGLPIALMRVSPSHALRIVAGGYIQLIQGTPLLILLFLTYFGLPALGVTVSPLMAAGASLTIYVSAYLGEIWRGSIESVPKQQWEAAEGLALSRSQRMIKVILPQAFRIATPPTVGFMVQIVKNTSLASAIGFIELVRAGQMINNATFRPFIVFVLIAALYFALCYPLSAWSRRLEGKFDVAHR